MKLARVSRPASPARAGRPAAQRVGRRVQLCSQAVPPIPQAVASLSGPGVTVANRQRSRPVDYRLLRRVLAALLDRLGPPAPAQLHVALVDARTMTRLNETYLRHAGPTDVLAFDYGRPTAGSAAAGPCGEVILCVDEAVAQARRFRTSWPKELTRYLVHGVLHLRGFRDATPAARRRMKRAEDSHLRALARAFPLNRLARLS